MSSVQGMVGKMMFRKPLIFMDNKRRSPTQQGPGAAKAPQKKGVA